MNLRRKKLKQNITVMTKMKVLPCPYIANPSWYTTHWRILKFDCSLCLNIRSGFLYLTSILSIYVCGRTWVKLEGESESMINKDLNSTYFSTFTYTKWYQSWWKILNLHNMIHYLIPEANNIYILNRILKPYSFVHIHSISVFTKTHSNTRLQNHIFPTLIRKRPAKLNQWWRRSNHWWRQG